MLITNVLKKVIPPQTKVIYHKKSNEILQIIDIKKWKDIYFNSNRVCSSKDVNEGSPTILKKR